jgi:hypothetical protein
MRKKTKGDKKSNRKRRKDNKREGIENGRIKRKKTLIKGNKREVTEGQGSIT